MILSLIWQDIQAIAANTRASVIHLSGDAGAFVLSAVSAFQSRSAWIQEDGAPVDDGQFDEIEALTAKAYTQLMTDVAIGSIFPFITSAPPTGALECDGATYLRVDYPDLYAALDSAFIVDADHFIVPDLRGRTIIGVGTGSGLSTYAMNASGGQESHQLSVAELAVHTHTSPPHTHTESPHVHSYDKGNSQTFHPGTGTNEFKLNGFTATATSAAASTLSSDAVTIDNAGSGTAHENRQPYLALRYALWAV